MELVNFILILVVVVYVSGLGKRLKNIENDQLKKTLQQNPVQPAVQTSVPTVSVATPAQTHFAPQQVETRKIEDSIVTFIKEDFLVKLGSLLLLFAFGWAVSYAFANNWIGPVGRIALGLVAGLAVMAFGTVWIRKNFHQAAIFLVLGLSIFNLTIFAARFIYEFFTPSLALALMFLMTVYVAALSVRHNSQALALTCILIAGIAPLFTNGEPSVVGLFGYLFVFVIGVMWIVSIRAAWPALIFAALLVVSFYSVPYLLNTVSEPERLVAIISANIFALLFTSFNIFSIIQKQTAEIIKEHMYVGIGTALFLLAWILNVSEGLREKFLLITWSIIFVIVALAFLYLKQNVKMFYLFASIALLFVATATAVIFDGMAMKVAYILETGLVVVLSHLMVPNVRTTRYVSLLLIGPALLALQSISEPVWQQKVFHKDFFVVTLFIVVSFFVGYFLREINKATYEKDTVSMYRTIIYGAGAFLLGVIWLTTHAAIASEDLATTVSLVIFTLIGLSLYVYGRSAHIQHYQYAGGIVLVLVIAQLLLVEVWKMKLLERVGTFFLIGILLISTAFYGRKKKDAPSSLPQ